MVMNLKVKNLTNFSKAFFLPRFATLHERSDTNVYRAVIVL